MVSPKRIRQVLSRTVQENVLLAANGLAGHRLQIFKKPLCKLDRVEIHPWVEGLLPKLASADICFSVLIRLKYSTISSGI
jgi:hypothetical protein